MENRGNPDAVQTAENRDQRSELLRKLMVAATGIEGFRGRTAQEIFDPSNEQSRREIIDRISAEQYGQLISGVNGVLRGKRKEDWGMDGVGVTAAGHEVIGKHIFPRHEDKLEIMTKVWEAAQAMNAEGRDLEDIGMLLGSMLVEVHPFADGNGRTSRLVYTLVKDGYSEQKLKAILGEEGREEVDMALTKVDINELFENKHGRGNASVNSEGIHGILPDDGAPPYSGLTFPEGIDPEVRESIIEAGRNDERIFTAAILEFLHTREGLSAQELVKSYGQRKVLLVQKLLSVLTAEEANELERTYWNLKKTYTEEMIDIFVHPDKPEYRVRDDGSETRLLDVFKQRIAERTMLIE